MSADRTITRAARHGARTQPVENTHGGRRPRHTGPAFTPEQLADAIKRARAQRITEDIHAYAQRKAS